MSTRIESAREGQTYAGQSLPARLASLVKLPHTLFALPFAGVGAVLASYEHPGGLTAASVLWILLAFTSARFAAMGFNRIVDRRWDALNPRTRMREIPAGKLTVTQAALAVAAASALFLVSAWQLNPLCGALAPVALGWVFFYSYTKRFTAAAHLVLGLGLGIAPVGAMLAVAGVWPEPWYAPVALAAAVMFWVAGFDMLYALADLDFDRAHGLHSVPARLGFRGATRLARAFHVVAALLFAAVWALGWFPVGAIYAAGVGVMAALLVYEHRLLAGQTPATLDLARLDKAFFKVNVGVSATVFLATLLDRLLLA